MSAASEGCSCGATFTYTASGTFAASEIAKALERWRSQHQHVEPPAPVIVRPRIRMGGRR